LKRAEYEVLAVRYGTRSSVRSENYLNFHSYGEPDSAIEVDYFFWVVRGGGSAIIVDTGFFPEAGQRRGRTSLCTPADVLPRLGLSAADIGQVVVTHAHYDHIGNLYEFPGAEIVMARREYEFWTSPVAGRQQFAMVSEPGEIDRLRSAREEGRLTLFDGSYSSLPGIELVEVGGHTPGQLVVVVATPAGRVVLASDALHFYEELELDRPFHIVADLPRMYRVYDQLGEMAAEPGTRLVAGHDPEVRTRFAAHAAGDDVVHVTDLSEVARDDNRTSGSGYRTG
jgi:glyoxylase-like metal-dependent hydrolase (beta-lactamase superfamily II)